MVIYMKTHRKIISISILLSFFSIIQYGCTKCTCEKASKCISNSNIRFNKTKKQLADKHYSQKKYASNGAIEINLFDGRKFKGTIINITKKKYIIYTKKGIITIPAIKVAATQTIK